MNEYKVTAPNGQETYIWAYNAVSAIVWYAGTDYGYGWKAEKQS